MADKDALTGTILDYAQWQGAPGDKVWNNEGFRPGVAAAHPVGVRYQGPWHEVANGFHEHVRRQARALATVGCPVHLLGLQPLMHYGVKPGSDEHGVLARNKDMLEASIGRVAVVIQQVVPNEGQLTELVSFRPKAMRALDPEDMKRLWAQKVIYTVWERSPAPPPDVEALSKIGQAWVACQENGRMLVASGVPADKVRVVPLPYLDTDPLLALDGRPRTAPKEIVRFYHIGKWEPRKDQHRLIGNFLRAFSPGEAELFLKTSPFAGHAEGYPAGPLASAKHWMTHDAEVLDQGWRFPDAPDVETQARGLGAQGLKIYDVRLTEQQIRGLHMACDVYVSLSHGEGFDMPAFDSKLAGNLMLYTPSGGPQDFAGDRDLFVAAVGTLVCHPVYRWAEGSEYIDYEDDAAVEAFRVARERVLRGERRRGMDIAPFSAKAVGKIMLGHLRELASDLPGEG